MPTTTKTPAEQLERANRAVLLWSQTPRNQYSTELCDMLGESLRAALEQLDAARAARQAAQRDLERQRGIAESLRAAGIMALHALERPAAGQKPPRHAEPERRD